MKSIFNKLNLFKNTKIRHIYLNKIDDYTHIDIENILQNINKFNSECIFLSLVVSNSISFNKSLLISSVIKDYKNKKDSVPIYIFAEDSLIGPPLLIFLSGTKSFSHKQTIFGFYDFVVNKINKKKLLEKIEVNFEYIVAGDNKVKLNDMKEYTEEDKIWMKKLIEKRKEFFIDEIMKVMKSKIFYIIIFRFK